MPNYKVIDADKFDSDLTMLADGIRAKIGTNAPLHFPDEMAEAIRTRGAKIVPKTIEANGEYYAEEDGADGYSPLTVSVGDAELESFIVGDTTELTLRTITQINNYAFQRDTKITKLTAPNVTKIGDWAFNLSDVLSISMPKLKEIGIYAFKESSIETLDAPQVEKIGMYAFNLCESLGLTSLPNALRYIGNYAFHNSSVKIRELPEHLETIGDVALNGAIISEFPASIKSIGINSIGGANGVITFKGIPEYIASSALSSSVKTINVPWSEYWVPNAPWGATNATINYNVFEPEVPLQGTWRFKERFEEGDEFLYSDPDNGDLDYWFAEIEFTSNGKEFVSIEWDGGLMYMEEDGTYQHVMECVEDEEGNIYYEWTDEAYRDIVTTSNWHIYVEDGYSGIGVTPYFFYRWMTNNAEKL